MVSCLGASCDLAGGWLPLDRSASCPAGEVWTNAGCAQCGPGSFATPAMSPVGNGIASVPLRCAGCELGLPNGCGSQNQWYHFGIGAPPILV